MGFWLSASLADLPRKSHPAGQQNTNPIAGLLSLGNQGDITVSFIGYFGHITVSLYSVKLSMLWNL